MSDVTNRSATPSLTGSVVKSISRFSGAVVMTWVVVTCDSVSELRSSKLAKVSMFETEKFNQVLTLKYFLNNSLRQYDLVGVEPSRIFPRRFLSCFFDT